MPLTIENVFKAPVFEDVLMAAQKDDRNVQSRMVSNFQTPRHLQEITAKLDTITDSNLRLKVDHLLQKVRKKLEATLVIHELGERSALTEES